MDLRAYRPVGKLVSEPRSVKSSIRLVRIMSSSSLESAPPSAWQLLALLTSLNVINFVDRQLITSLQIPLRDDPELTERMRHDHRFSRTERRADLAGDRKSVV